MEQKQISCGSELAPLSTKWPLLVAQHHEPNDEDDNIGCSTPCGLQGGVGESKCLGDFKPEDTTDDKNESNGVDIPFHILTMIMKCCVGVEYLNFRATCKYFHIAAPIIQWINNTGLNLKKLETNPLVSPWLMMFDKHQGRMTFTDLTFGNKYFIKTPRDLVGDNLPVRYSGYGWLLLYRFPGPIVLFNPFSNDIRKLPFVLPKAPVFESFSFSAPPTSRDCMVVGLTPHLTYQVHVRFLNRESSWRRFQVDFGCTVPRSFRFPTFYDGDLYTLAEGRLDVFRGIEGRNCFWDVVIDKDEDDHRDIDIIRGIRVRYFLVKCDASLILVMVNEIVESVEVFKLNESRQKWEKMDGIGYMIYICDTTCVCMEAKIPKMEGQIVYYSLETSKYYIFNERGIQVGDLFGTKYLGYPRTWIEPSWC